MSQDSDQVQTQRLPADPEQAINILTQQVNVLNGRVAALLTLIKEMGFEIETSEADLKAKATSRLPPVFLPANGPTAYTNYASTALAELLAKD